MNDPNRDIQAAIASGIAQGTHRVTPGFKPTVLVPEMAKLVPLERLLEPERPERVKAHPKFDDAGSLIEYFNRFKDASSFLFADIDNSTIVAVIDGHETGGAKGARYCEHRATFTAKHSPEWSVWVGNDGEAKNQTEFAQFIEDNAPDVKRPAAGDLYEMALRFEATKGASFKSAIRLDNGSTAINFQEETAGSVAGGKIEIPKEIGLLLRVYVGDEPQDITARFRYRLNGGSLSLWYDLLRIENLKRTTFDAIVEKVAEATGTVVLKGRAS